MTARAREALADCEHALADFEASANTPYQRSRWVAVMTLLRTVGLVLKAVDGEAATPEVQRRIDEAWERLKASKPDPRIFHDFIRAERNDVVHLYEVRSGVNVTIRLGGGGTGGSSTPSGPATYDFFMRDGPFKSASCGDMRPRPRCRERRKSGRAGSPLTCCGGPR